VQYVQLRVCAEWFIGHSMEENMEGTLIFLGESQTPHILLLAVVDGEVPHRLTTHIIP